MYSIGFILFHKFSWNRKKGDRQTGDRTDRRQKDRRQDGQETDRQLTGPTRHRTDRRQMKQETDRHKTGRTGDRADRRHSDRRETDRRQDGQETGRTGDIQTEEKQAEDRTDRRQGWQETYRQKTGQIGDRLTGEVSCLSLSFQAPSPIRCLCFPFRSDLQYICELIFSYSFPSPFLSSPPPPLSSLCSEKLRAEISCGCWSHLDHKLGVRAPRDFTS